jgi:hypothetical protein
VIGSLAELLRFVALVLQGAASESPLPAVLVAGALVSAALILAIMLSAGVIGPTGPSMTALAGTDVEVLVRLRQSNPDAAGHSRSRAPGQGG